MKGTMGFMLLFLVAAMALPFFTLGPGGKPLLSPSSLGIGLPKLPGSSGTTTESATTSKPAAKSGLSSTLYKWQDSSGQWVFSDKLPPAGVNYSKVKLKNTGTMPTPPPPPVEAETAATTTPPPLNPTANPYSVENVQEMVEAANNVQTLMDNRKAAMDKALDGM